VSSLRHHFTGVAAKYLSAVDATPRSRQHEIGSNSFVEILGNPGAEKVPLEGTFLYFDDESESPLKASGTLTWYDTRLNQDNRRPEFRLYYRVNAVTTKMTAGDFCLVAARPDGTVMLIISPKGSTSEKQIRWLFNVDELPLRGFDVRPVSQTRSVDLIETMVLEELGIEVISDGDMWLDTIIGRFGTSFPGTAAFSHFARETCQQRVGVLDDPDNALMRWMEHEEILFRTLERYIVQQKLDEGFSGVEEFIKFSLSVQNRRKARVGYALEHHLAAVFDAHCLPYGRQVKTENRATADFLFPSQAAYGDTAWPDSKLIMLASKSTCKDRWRQVLAEAKRIPEKHLLTLEPAISSHQIEEMKAHHLRLVVPAPLQSTYSSVNQQWLLSLASYIELTRSITA